MTYALLQADVQNWCARSDFPVNVYSLATALINRKLRVREMLSDFTATTSVEAVSLPSDFLEFQALYIDRDPRVVLTAGNTFEQTANFNASGIPGTYVINGSSLTLNPIPDGSYNLVGRYYAKLADFSVSSDTNAVLTAYPEIYLAASLAMVYMWAQDAEEQQKWLAALEGAVTNANKADTRARFSGPIKMRPRAYA